MKQKKAWVFTVCHLSCDILNEKKIIYKCQSYKLSSDSIPVRVYKMFVLCLCVCVVSLCVCVLCVCVCVFVLWDST